VRFLERERSRVGPPYNVLTQPTRRMGSATSGVRRQLGRSAHADRFAPSLPNRRTRSPSQSGRPALESLLHGELVNRSMNALLSGIALLLLLPVLIVIAVVVKLSSRGPVFYLQERVGLDRRALSRAALNHRRRSDLGGQPFTIYKFRTMRVDAERESGAVWAQQHDPRVTPVGRILRQYRLDELPQLFNVLRGEMNIVGPRPERPAIFAQLRTHIAEYPLRQRAKPGITGLAQINHHYDRSLDDVRTKVSYDLEYIRRQSVREDLRIMLKTIPVILWRRGGW
jgi:lipopolysaccharide/colanic/teichoic acid biosynthesis glycosyltransferase